MESRIVAQLLASMDNLNDGVGINLKDGVGISPGGEGTGAMGRRR